MLKFRRLFQKTVAVFIAALPSTTAFVVGDIGTIMFFNTYDRYGNAIRYNSSVYNVLRNSPLLRNTRKSAVYMLFRWYNQDNKKAHKIR